MINLYVQLSGGLGNQLFQYATGRALSLNSKVNLIVDNWSGFFRDKQYKRQYELTRFPAKIQCISAPARTALLIHRLKNKFQTINPTFYERRWYGDFYTEVNLRYEPSLASAKFNRNTWLLGYWQSPKYFHLYESLLREELLPPQPTDQHFLNLAQVISSCESVALGVRFYEESSNPADHALNGKLKTINDINATINELRYTFPHAKFFVFSTFQSPDFKKFELPADVVFVNPETGFRDAVDCLWLLAQCKHHIFTNSSYYWWGAWLSHATHHKQEQIIYAADNFINIDGICEHWKRF